MSWDLQAAYDIAADHRVMLVVYARDRLYSDDNPSYSALRIGSEARLDLPLG
ncbi:hypothetical protein [Streptomyces sp. SudanB182_2057]|uniref:hypothetical protein n=1 Tax=Streptomyces sp. SudanB182_2057 TaxID=3035281 RepID=UPI003F558F30